MPRYQAGLYGGVTQVVTRVFIMRLIRTPSALVVENGASQANVGASVALFGVEVNKVWFKAGAKMKSYCSRQHKILKLHLVFMAIVAFILSANMSYGDVYVELMHVDTTQYPTIMAYLTVTDENGDLIADLTTSNFSIFEDENERTPESATLLQSPADPVAVALSLDYSGSMVEPNAIEDMQTAALLFINQLRAGYDDACEIIKFDWSISVEQAFTTDKGLLRDAVNRSWSIDWTGTKIYDAAYKAVQDTAAYVASEESPRSVVVASDGWEWPEGASSHSLGDVISLAVSNGIRVFAVGFGSVNAGVLQRMADETGGRYFYAPTLDDLKTIYLAIATEHAGGYIISYETSATGCQDHILRISLTTNTGLVAEDSKSFLICPQDDGGDQDVPLPSGMGCFIATAAAL